MKKRNFVVIMCVVAILFCGTNHFALAESSEKINDLELMQDNNCDNCKEYIELRFSNVNARLDGYSDNNVYVEYSFRDKKEIASIYDRNSNELLEEVSIKKLSLDVLKRANKLESIRSGNIHPFIFTRSRTFGGVTLDLDITCEMYTSGSFRQIRAYLGSYLGISSTYAPMSIEDKNVNVWSTNNKFPTLKLNYSYSGTLVSEVSRVTGGSVSAQLLGNGFSLSYSSGYKDFYRLPFRATGGISLY